MITSRPRAEVAGLIKTRVRVGQRTKDLVQQLQPGECAVINHEDLDETAAHALVSTKVRLVVNAARSISGRYPNQGPLVLVEAGIPLLDSVGPEVMDLLDGEEVEVAGDRLVTENGKIFNGKLLDRETVLRLLEESKANFQKEMERFVANTVEYARKELDILKGMAVPPLDISFRGRHVLVVVRGQSYKDDLQAIRGYIREVRPILIGVDGGADALLECGFRPDIIIGDMDSITDKALGCGARLIVHAYPDGRAPGLNRLEALRLNGMVLPAPGTSEDVALLLAYEKGADLIVAVGTHSNVIDFLEKGRKGMASTFLVRLKVGTVLVDARGVSKLYRQRIHWRYLAEIVLAAVIPFAVVFTLSPATLLLLRLFLMRMRVVFKW
ncbi:thiamin pyrophosphokinase [Clostridiales bacterium PH28_bin88]|nr:thiamin pyrophosphokinase [Clostridiales bacterium PH28_bin88]